MEYHSNIKEYQSNIIDTSKSKINLSEGNSPSSDSDVNMSEGNSQPSVSADNSPPPADNVQNPAENAPAPAPIDVVQRENQLEVEANDSISNLHSAIKDEEDLVDETGDIEKEIEESLVVDRYGQILDTEDNNRKRSRDVDSSDDEDNPKRARYTYGELEAEKDTLDTKEEELAKASERVNDEIDRLKEIQRDTGRDTTRRAIEEALASLGPRAKSPSPDSNVGGNSSGGGSPRI